MNTIKKINPLTRTLEEFINLSNNKHNNLYTYENAIYINTMTKLKITCKIHGDFEQIPKAHLIGQGCKHCAIIRRTNSRKMTQQNFINKSNIKHNNLYTYKNVIYIDSKTKVRITCKIHGDFEQIPNSHLRKRGCPKCGLLKNKIINPLNMNKFINNANIKHNNLYTYKNIIYIDSQTKVRITCKIHGDFEQTPNYHIQGGGCSKCNKSKGELKILNYLKENDILYEDEKIHYFLSQKIIYDFYIPSKKLYIITNTLYRYS